MYQPESTRPLLPTTCTLVPAQNGCYRMHIQGKCPPQWLAGLSSGLAGRGINILQGNASKSGPAVWEASFLIAPPQFLHSSKVEQLDFLSMTQGHVAPPPADPRLSWYHIALQDDTLEVEVKGADSIGFLVSLLKLFAFYSLFPTQVMIDTPAGMVHDSFFLKALGGTAPSRASMDGLEKELARLRQ
jgi:hypothetical protein